MVSELASDPCRRHVDELVNHRPSVFYPETEVIITRLVTRLHTLTLSLVALRTTGTHSLILVFYPETELRSALQIMRPAYL